MRLLLEGIFESGHYAGAVKRSGASGGLNLKFHLVIFIVVQPNDDQATPLPMEMMRMTAMPDP